MTLKTNLRNTCWLFMIIFMVAGCTGLVEQTENTVKIGANYALSGSLALYGTWASNGINLAVDKVNSEGGVSGKKVEIVFEDSQGSPSKAVTAYHKLRNFDGVNYLITYQSSIALAIAPLANEDRIIQMDVSATVPTYSTPNDYTFRTGIVATQLAIDAADVLYNKLGKDKVAVLYINNDQGVEMKNVFKDYYEGEILIEEAFDQDAFDFRTQLLKLKSADAFDVFLITHLREGGLIVKQAAEMVLDLTFFGHVYGIEGEEFLKGARESAEGILYVAPKFDLESDDEAIASFVAEYKEKYGENPNYFAAQSYDGVMALIRALKNCGSADTECVREELMKLDYEGASGKIKFDINGDTAKPVGLKVVQGGKFVSYEEQ